MAYFVVHAALALPQLPILHQVWTLKLILYLRLFQTNDALLLGT